MLKAQRTKALRADVVEELVWFDDESVALIRPVHRAATEARRTSAATLYRASRGVDDKAARLALELTLTTAITLSLTSAGIASRSDVAEPRVRLGGCYACC